MELNEKPNAVAVKKSLQEFLIGNTGATRLRDSDDVFSLGLMNSLLVIHLVSFVEGEFGVRLRGDDLEPKHFRTVNALTELITGKMI